MLGLEEKPRGERKPGESFSEPLVVVEIPARRQMCRYPYEFVASDGRELSHI